MRIMAESYRKKSIDLSIGFAKSGVMKFFLPLMIFVAPVSFADPEKVDLDWRVELLAEEGIGLSVAELQKALEGGGEVPDHKGVYRELGDRDFKKREVAQRKLAASGQDGLKWLRSVKPSSDPEVRRRVAEVIFQLESLFRQDRETAIEHALRSLLAEGENRRKDTGGLFFEWFGTAEEKLNKKYRNFLLQNTADRPAEVKGGSIRFAGKKGKDGDQRLILKSSVWPQRETFGKSFEVSASLGAEPVGAGAWHMGITIGNVRALFHPGMNRGSFRFERVDNNRHLTGSVGIGFEPGGELLHWMSVKVTKLPDDQVRLDVVLLRGDKEGQRFELSTTCTSEDIGDLDRVSFDRSGRSGGEAYFRDLMIKLAP